MTSPIADNAEAAIAALEQAAAQVHASRQQLAKDEAAYASAKDAAAAAAEAAAAELNKRINTLTSAVERGPSVTVEDVQAQGEAQGETGAAEAPQAQPYVAPFSA